MSSPEEFDTDVEFDIEARKVVLSKFIGSLWKIKKYRIIAERKTEKDRELDTVGIDLVFVTRNNEFVTMGLRNQRGNIYKYKTFTIREKRCIVNGDCEEVEYHRIVEAIEQDRVYPQYICHCYLTEDMNIQYGAIARTKSLIELMRTYPGIVKSKTTKMDRNGLYQVFKVIETKDIKRISFNSIVVGESENNRVLK